MQVYQQPIISINGRLFEGFYSCDGCGETLLIVDVAKDYTLSEKGHEVLDAFCPLCLNWLGTLRDYPIEMGEEKEEIKCGTLIHAVNRR